ncbi:NAD(P)-binding protein [Sarocladium strictum]
MPPPRGYPNFIEGPADYDMTQDVHNDTYSAIESASADFSGKAVYLSGASRGIGVGIAISFARAGASKIAVSARSSSQSTVDAMLKAAKEAGRPEPEILSLAVDLTSMASVTAAAEEIKNKFGRLDIIVNNAGVMTGYQTAVADLSEEDWKMNFEVNVHGPWRVLKAFLPLLLETEKGSKTIVTVASVGAHLVSPGLSGYQTSKLAVLRLTQFAMAEHGSQGLLTYCVHPGNIDTGMADLAEEIKPIFVDTPALCGDTLVYLTSERREWLGGRYVNVTWDMPQLMAKEKELVEGDKLKVRMVV